VAFQAFSQSSLTVPASTVRFNSNVRRHRHTVLVTPSENSSPENRASSKLKPTPYSILWPMAFPVGIFLLMQSYLATGGVLYAHGPSMLFLACAVAAGTVVAAWEASAVVRGATQLYRSPRLRTRTNLLALLAASAYVVASVVWAYHLYAGRW
jgi:hypothetical protein